MYELSDKISKEYLSIVEEIFEEICKESSVLGRRLRKDHIAPLKSAIRCFIRNYVVSNKRKMVISLDRNTYTSDIIIYGYSFIKIQI